MAQLRLANISKRFGDTEVLRDISLEIDNEELMVFVGPSGCGKSTLLRIIAGFETPSRGEIAIGGSCVNHLEPAERGIAMVFQNYALYPHMSAADNIGFCLRNLRMPKAEVERRVARVAEALQIKELLPRLPGELSGGQRQRVAIGRAIVREPQVYLFDEPLSNLDAILRVRTRVEIARLHQRQRKTMVYVTHDQTEAMTLASRIAVLNRGCLEQVGAPLEIYDSPRNIFVARFIGSPSMGFIAGELRAASAAGADVTVAGGMTVRVHRDARRLAANAPVTLGVRPERLRVCTQPGGIPATVSVAERLGSHTLFHCLLEDGTALVAEEPLDNSRIGRSTQVFLEIPSSETHVFDSSGAALPRLPR
jgi:ABC-type sugar transport system ATPase subunit